MDKFIANLTKLRSVFGECVLHAKSEEDNRWLVRWLVDQLCEDEMWSTTHMNEDDVKFLEGLINTYSLYNEEEMGRGYV